MSGEVGELVGEEAGKLPAPGAVQRARQAGSGVWGRGVSQGKDEGSTMGLGLELQGPGGQ